MSRYRSSNLTTGTQLYAGLSYYKVDVKTSKGVVTVGAPYSSQAVGTGSSESFKRESMLDSTEGGPRAFHPCDHSVMEVVGVEPGVIRWSEVLYSYTGTNFDGSTYTVDVTAKWTFENRGYTGFMSTNQPAFIDHVPLPAGELSAMVSSIVKDLTSVAPKENLGVSLAEIAGTKDLLLGFKNLAMKSIEILSNPSAYQTLALKNNRTLRFAANKISASWILYQWAIKPLLDDIHTIRNLDKVVIKRYSQLMRRSEKNLACNRKKEVSSTLSDGTIVRTKYNLSCKGAPAPYINDPEALINALTGCVFGLSRFVETLWAAAPMSFAVDATQLAPIKDMAAALDRLINDQLAIMDAIIIMPTQSQVRSANWTLSRKTTSERKFVHNLNLSIIRYNPTRTDTVRKEVLSVARGKKYTREVFDLSSMNGAYPGILPKWELLGSLGTLWIMLRTNAK